jgi:flagellar biosynthesis/type III secretory pathway protein FliH
MEFRMDQMTRDSLIISMQKRVFEEGREHGLQEGREHGLQEGREHGLQEGREHGLSEGKRTSLFAILHARGFVISEEQRALLSSCSDPAQLDRWITRAVLAASLSDLFE